MMTNDELTAKLKECLETIECPGSKGHEWDDIYCCQDCIMKSLLALVTQQRKEAVEEATQVLNDMWDQFAYPDGKGSMTIRGKWDGGLTVLEECYDFLRAHDAA